MGLFGRKKEDAPSLQGSEFGRLDRVRQLALAGNDEAVEKLLLQMEADGVAGLATEALDLGIELWATDKNPLAAQCVLTVVPMLDSASDDEFLQANLYAGYAFDDLEMDEMSIVCLRYAADGGLAEAQFMLAMALDGAEFLRYLNMAASQGDESALTFIRDHPDEIALAGGDERMRPTSGAIGGGGGGDFGGLSKSGKRGLAGSLSEPGRYPGLGDDSTTSQRFCTSCGTPLGEAARFCASCGSQVG